MKFGKGTSLYEVYYYLSMLNAQDRIEELRKCVKINKWWVDNMKEGPRNQIMGWINEQKN